MRTIPFLVIVPILFLAGCEGSSSRPQRRADADPSTPPASAISGPVPTTVSRLPFQPFQVEGITFVPLPEGYVVVGSPSDEPGRDADTEGQRLVPITAQVWLSSTEVTQMQYESVLGQNPSLTRGPNLPVTTVSWDEARAFCAALTSRHPGLRFELPSEPVWEYACRAGSMLPFAPPPGQQADLERAWQQYRGGDADLLTRWLSRSACFNSDRPQAVAMLLPNIWGFHDLHGNVWEWCAGEHPDNSDLRPIRGGGWSSPDPLGCRAALRGFEPRDTRKDSIGFRVMAMPDT